MPVGILRARRPATLLVPGSIRTSPGSPHVADQSEPNPTSPASQGICGTGMVASFRPVAGSSR